MESERGSARILHAAKTSYGHTAGAATRSPASAPAGVGATLSAQLDDGAGWNYIRIPKGGSPPREFIRTAACSDRVMFADRKSVAPVLGIFQASVAIRFADGSFTDVKPVLFREIEGPGGLPPGTGLHRPVQDPHGER